MTTQRPLVEKVLGVALYVPVGVAVQLRDDVPRLIAIGRTRVEERLRVAHWVGEMAVAYGRQTIERRLAASASESPAAIESTVASNGAVASADVASPGRAAKSSSKLDAPFEGYDNLAAAQIVQLLARLPHPELQLIRQYESSRRGRRTVLAKIEQLLAT